MYIVYAYILCACVCVVVVVHIMCVCMCGAKGLMQMSIFLLKSNLNIHEYSFLVPADLLISSAWDWGAGRRGFWDRKGVMWGQGGVAGSDVLQEEPLVATGTSGLIGMV